MGSKVDQDYLISLKERFDLVAVIGETVELRPIGNGEFKGRCPFHNEDTASFSVNKNRYHCFGCHVHGDLFEWIIKTTGKTFPQAIKSLSSGTVPMAQGEAIKERSLPTHTPYESKLVESILDVNSVACEYFSEVEIDDIAQVYSEDRFHSSAHADFTLGYAPPDREGLINYLLKAGFSHETMHMAGLVAQAGDGTWYSRLRDRLILPILNRNYDILGFIGRIIPRPGNERLPKYVNPPTTHAYEKRRNLFGIEKYDEALGYCILVEGQIDVVSLHTAGIYNVMSIGGSEFTRQQHDIINELKCPKVFFFMDGDMAGLTASFKATKFIHEANYHGFNILLTDGMDPDSWIRGPAKDSDSPLRTLPIIKSTLFYTSQLVTNDMKQEYDRSLLDELSRPYVMDNIKNHWPHYNVVDWVMAAYPEFSKEIKEAAIAMAKDTVDLPNGKKGLKEERVKEFIKSWLKPSREVRKLHANQFKTKGR